MLEGKKFHSWFTVYPKEKIILFPEYFLYISFIDAKVDWEITLHFFKSLISVESCRRCYSRRDGWSYSWNSFIPNRHNKDANSGRWTTGLNLSWSKWRLRNLACNFVNHYKSQSMFKCNALAWHINEPGLIIITS